MLATFEHVSTFGKYVRYDFSFDVSPLPSKPTDAKLDKRLFFLFKCPNVHELHLHSVIVHHFSARPQLPLVARHPLAVFTNK